MKKLTILLMCIASTAFAGTDSKDKSIIAVPTPPYESLYKDKEFNISILGAGSWTQTSYANDQYLGVDHSFGGTLAANYFFARYFGVGLGLSGYYVRNLVAAGNGTRRFVGDVLPQVTVRYPIGTSPFAPYVRVGCGPIFNGGNKSLQEPDGSFGNQIRFEALEHNAQMLIEGAGGVEYRLTHNIGIVTEAAFDKVTRPQSNFGTVRAGVNVAF